MSEDMLRYFNELMYHRKSILENVGLKDKLIEEKIKLLKKHYKEITGFDIEEDLKRRISRRGLF